MIVAIINPIINAIKALIKSIKVITSVFWQHHNILYGNGADPPISAPEPVWKWFYALSTPLILVFKHLLTAGDWL